jgi:hypothetical protein
MPATSDSPADLLDEPMPFEFLDPKHNKHWELLVSGRTLDHEKAIQRYLEKRAYQVIQTAREYMTMDVYHLSIDLWLQQCATGRYAFGGIPCYEALGDKHVYAYDVWLHLAQHNNAVTQELVGRILDDPDKADEMAALLGRVDDPNRRRQRRDGSPALPKTHPEQSATATTVAPS